MKSKNIGKYRKSYEKKYIDDKNLDKIPFHLFEKWFNDACDDNSIDEPNAMSLSTIGLNGYPRTRVVLLKEFGDDGYIFYTNYNSRKGESIKVNSRVSLSFFWPSLERQIIITGNAIKISDQKSEKYFNERPKGSKIGAIISPQSQIIPDRLFLEKKIKNLSENNIKKPNYWGGYIVKPIIFEFWQGRPNRLHDRIEFVLNETNEWINYRLAP